MRIAEPPYADPFLAPYSGEISGRARRVRETEKRLLGGRSGARALADWASAHEYYGLHKRNGRWIFREWAPNATAVRLVGDFTGWRRDARFELKRLPGRDVWEGTFPAGAVSHGDFYHLEIEWPGGGGERIPAYARRAVQDERTKLFAAQAWAPGPYRWKHRSPPRRPGAAPLIYEAHVGMAQEEGKVGSYAEFRDRVLPRIKAAGYDTVQLMGIMEHPYYASFGYHVSSFFAASSRFGTPEELKSLVDAAHGMGLRVTLDLVHSHAVKNERDGLSRFDGTDCQYFHSGARGVHSAWDSRCFDYGKTDVLHFLLSNCRFWLDEYRFDGFRFDGVTSMLYLHHGLGVDFTGYPQYFDGSADPDAWTYLALANRVIHAVRRDAVTIAEDVSGMPGIAVPVEHGGAGFDYRMAMGVPDFWFKLASEVRDEDWSAGAIWHALTDRRREEKVVSYVESHDQALVGGKTFFFQLADAAVYRGMGTSQENAAIDRALALHKMARLATLALAGPAYLNFMGNEFGHPEWIDFPREGNGFDFSHARRQWSLRDDPSLRFKALGDFDEAMLAAAGPHRGKDPVLLEADEKRHVLAFWRDGLVFAFNFDPVRSYADLPVQVPPGRAFCLVLDTDETRFGGQGRIAPGQRFFPELRKRGSELVAEIKTYLPARTAVVLAREKGKAKR